MLNNVKNQSTTCWFWSGLAGGRDFGLILRHVPNKFLPLGVTLLCMQTAYAKAIFSAVQLQKRKCLCWDVSTKLEARNCSELQHFGGCSLAIHFLGPGGFLSFLQSVVFSILSIPCRVLTVRNQIVQAVYLFQDPKSAGWSDSLGAVNRNQERQWRSIRSFCLCFLGTAEISWSMYKMSIQDCIGTMSLAPWSQIIDSSHSSWRNICFTLLLCFLTLLCEMLGRNLSQLASKLGESKFRQFCCPNVLVIQVPSRHPIWKISTVILRFATLPFCSGVAFLLSTSRYWAQQTQCTRTARFNATSSRVVQNPACPKNTTLN